tara:strand:- start:482 stop:1054 length:573 start_codon:yes stop_codon:yes gene_type:complete
MFIQTEQTPNPLTLKFLPGRVVMEDDTIFFKEKSQSQSSPLATRLFSIDGVLSVFLGKDFITITKKEETEWQVLKPLLLGAITDHYSSGEEIIIDKKNIKKEKINESKIDDKDEDVVKKIKELLDTRVRPAVALDGGDIIFQNFNDGIVYLHMQGACSGCPSSTATLKMGIENMLKHYVPEVKEVRPVDA